ncbi:MAG: LytTR family transcriptional regulator DNA-binding domain-containing protein [Ferruginibacter sp.]
MGTKDKFSAIIIDDEYPARLMMKSLAANHAEMIEIVGEAKNAIEATRLINELKPDLIFLDITMPGMNGFELLSVINYQPFVIFTTAYEQYAIKAFETNSIDYLLKPIEEKRFDLGIQKLLRFAKINKKHELSQLKTLFSDLQQAKRPSAIPIKAGNKFILLRFEEVAYLEAKDKYVYVVTSSGKQHLSDTRLNEFEETLPGAFLRIHKSYIINTAYITEIHKYFGNRLIITLNDNKRTKITSGITYIEKIREALGL